jgi:hypothetical protein
MTVIGFVLLVDWIQYLTDLSVSVFDLRDLGRLATRAIISTVYLCLIFRDSRRV